MDGIEGGVLLVLVMGAIAAWPACEPTVEEPPCGPSALRELRRDGLPPRLLCAADCPACPPPSGASALLLGRPIDVNAAGADDLAAIPGVGPALAARIVGEREAGGPFRSIDDLARVRGLGPGRVRSLAPWLVAGGSPARYKLPPGNTTRGVPRADSLREVRDALQPR